MLPQRGNLKKKVVTLCADHTGKLSTSVRHKNLLCHDDLWANNVLFKYNADGRPIECCLIDFQLARYNLPAHDILCVFQFTTMRKLRDEHSKTLFKFYYDSMTSVLKETGLNISEVYPWEGFVESIQDLYTMCMTHSVLNTPIMLLKPSRGAGIP